MHSRRSSDASTGAFGLQVALLRDTIRRQRKVAISYEDAHGSLSDRTIWPIAIVYFDEVRVLAAWCEHRSAFRHFRVDRLHLRTILDERYPGATAEKNIWNTCKWLRRSWSGKSASSSNSLRNLTAELIAQIVRL
ncbi:helix-turn-helix transcriptional regulator [Bradyrhizobium sp. PUT101]|uniref:helix-turn-helix transcriptional regulator n=1 Tax=Bradyrhizobium sp. PUT101 TaxID=3447427 RepID=UPI003F8703A5